MKGLLRRIDRWQRRHRWSAFLFAVLKKFSDDQAGNLAALVAYYAIFSVFPLLLVMSTILGFVLHGHPQWQADVTNSALKNLPVVGHHEVPLRGSVVALVVGLSLALWSGLGIAKSAQTAFNTVYDVPRDEWPGFLRWTLRSLGIVTVGGIGLILTTTLSSAVTSVHSIGGLHVGVWLRIVGAVVAVLLNTLLFLTLFRWLTVRAVGWRDAWPGAVIAAAALQVLQLSVSTIITHKLNGARTMYGDFAALIVLLSWFYLQAQIVLFAAEVNVVRQDGLWPRPIATGRRLEPDQPAGLSAPG
jgi:membrane protein